MPLYETKILRPPTPSSKIASINLLGGKKYKKTEYMDQIFQLSWDKDMSSPTGTGTTSFPFSNNDKELLIEGNGILLKVGWVHPDGTHDYKEILSGFMANIDISDYITNLSLDDQGKLLEKEAEVSYTQMKRSAIITDIIKLAGLKPAVDFTGLKDDVIDYVAEDTSDSDSSGGDVTTSETISITDPKGLCGLCGYNHPGTSKTWKNYCPGCGKSGLLIQHPSGGTSDMEISCRASGGCTADYCPYCGRDLKPRAVYLKSANSSSSSTSSSGTDSTSSDEKVNGTDDSIDDSTESKKSYWDMLLDLIEPIEADAQIFNWLDTVYVHKVPDKKLAKLWVKEGINIVHGGLTINEANPETINTIVVKYGDKESKLEVIVKDDDLVKKYGEKKEEIDKPKMNRQQAEAYGYSQLEKKQRDSGFSIDVKVIGNSEWFIARWTKVKIPTYGINRTMYIDKISQSLSPDEEWLCDLHLVDYKPSQISKKTSDTSSINNSSIEKGLAKLRTKVHCYKCNGSCCSVPGCEDTTKCLDCFGMSEALYSLYNNNGQKCRIIQYPSSAARSGKHRIVQLYKDGKWVDHNYSGFNSGFSGNSSKNNYIIYKKAP